MAPSSTHSCKDTASNDDNFMEPAIKCMSVFKEGTRIAFACYDEEINKILIEESHISHQRDIENAIQAFMSVARPSLVLVSSKVASCTPLMDLLTKRPQPNDLSEIKNKENPPHGHSIPYQLLKTNAFDLRNCKTIILSKLRVLTLLRQQNSMGLKDIRSHRSHANTIEGYATTSPSAYHSLASIVDFDSSVLVRSLGSLLSFLQTNIFRFEEGATVTVDAIHHAQSSQFMRIDQMTLRSLHIFPAETKNALAAKCCWKNSNDGFNIYNLLDRTKSKMGKKCLKEWMLKPLLNPSAIRERHDGIDFFLNPKCQSSVNLLLKLLQKVGAVDKILIRMQKCHSAPIDFLILSKTIDAAITICNLLSEDFKQFATQDDSLETNCEMNLSNTCNFSNDQTTDRFQEKKAIPFLDRVLKNCHVQVLKDLYKRIVSIINEEMTTETKDSVIIHFGFHDDLDTAKDAFDHLDVGSQVLNKHPELRELKVVFFPQVGFLITIDKRQHSHDVATNEFPDLPKDFIFVFIQGDDAYFKNPDMQLIDDDIGDLDAFIKDTESMIVSDLEEEILECESVLRSTFEALAELDCILSFASCALDMNFVRPKILNSYQNSHQGYHIKNGRHPLQQLIIDDGFIPNDTILGSDKYINIVTGPNFSGKSCYTRQVGVLVYLAHIGSFLPCDEASISITDQIIAHMSSVETSAVPQSSFQLDLTKMAMLLRRITPRSLVLIDEFGKGTAPSSGIAVLTAALKQISSIKCRAICTTHFLEIFSLKLLDDNIKNILVSQMVVHFPDSEDDNAVPLFKLEDGVANSSAGIHCAKLAGVDTAIIDRANKIISTLKSGVPIRPVLLNSTSELSLCKSSKSLISFFLELGSWSNSSKKEIQQLQEKIAHQIQDVL